MNPTLKAAATRLLGSSLLTRTAFLFNGDRLRILAYHGISDPVAFDRQMRFLAEEMTPVGAEDLVAALHVGSLPARPVWVTFDDGDPSILDVGLPILATYGISATAFVCPGVIDTDEPYWWQVVEAAADRGLALEDEVTRLKQVPDPERRRRVVELRGAVEDAHGLLAVRQLTTGELQEWLEAGHSVGNHTWDHPLLDRCVPDEQRRQICQAHDWVEDNLAHDHRLLFAYPNGNHPVESEATLTKLGYETGLLFDHRIAHLGQPMRLSRLRSASSLSASSFRMAISGVHPVLHHGLLRP